MGGAEGARAPPIFGAITTMRGLKHRFSPTKNQAQGRSSPLNMKTITTSLDLRYSLQNMSAALQKCVDSFNI